MITIGDGGDAAVGADDRTLIVAEGWATSAPSGGSSGLEAAAARGSGDAATAYGAPCSSALIDFVEGYLQGHGYVALCVCVAGVVLNSAVIGVLAKKQMRNPVNTLLLLLALAELGLLVLYIPFDVIVYAAADESLPLFVTANYGAAMYILFYINASVLLHMIGTWMIITTALFRYACVQFPVQSATWCSQRRAKMAAASVAGACGVVSVPNMFRNAVVSLPDDELRQLNLSRRENSAAAAAAVGFPLYTINSSAPFFHNENLSRMNYWLYGLLGKILPSILLLVLTGLLVSLLRLARRRRMRLRCRGTARATATASSRDCRGDETLPTAIEADPETERRSRAADERGPRRRDRRDNANREHMRTTRMLLAVVVLFLAVDLPHGCLVIASAIDRCHLEAYNVLGDVIDLATLMAFSINFALYCSMSKRFRELFTDLLATCAAPLVKVVRLQRLKDALPVDNPTGGGRQPVSRTAPALRASARRKGGGGDGCSRRGGRRCGAPVLECAKAWSGKSSLESFHLEVDQRHTSLSQLLCSSSSEESLAARN